MAQATTELTEQGASAYEATIPAISQFLKAELAKVRSVKPMECPWRGPFDVVGIYGMRDVFQATT